MTAHVARVLIAHPDPATRAEVGRALHRAGEASMSVHEVDSPAQAVQGARRCDAELVLLDLTGERELALDVARALRAPDCAVVGLYNPLVLRDGETAFFRAAARAGVADFVPVPVADAELRAALAGVAGSRLGGTRSEGRVVTFFSPKGGVGTTTLAANTAVVLSASDLTVGEVALVDAHLQFGNVTAHFGLAPDHDLADLVRDLDDVQALSTHFTTHPPTHLRLLAAPRDAVEGDQIAPEDLGRVLIALRRRFEVVVVDAPSEIDLMTLAILDLSDRIFLVTEAVAPTILATARCLELLAGQGLAERVQIVVNRDGETDGRVADRLVREQLGREPEARVPEERSVIASINRGEPAVVARQQGGFAEAISGLAESVMRIGQGARGSA